MDYQSCTVEELAVYFLNKTSQAITQQMKYYEGRANLEVVAKIKKARILAKQHKLTLKLESM